MIWLFALAYAIGVVLAALALLPVIRAEDELIDQVCIGILCAHAVFLWPILLLLIGGSLIVQRLNQ